MLDLHFALLAAASYRSHPRGAQPIQRAIHPHNTLTSLALNDRAFAQHHPRARERAVLSKRHRERFWRPCSPREQQQRAS